MVLRYEKGYIPTKYKKKSKKTRVQCPQLFEFRPKRPLPPPRKGPQKTNGVVAVIPSVTEGSQNNKVIPVKTGVQNSYHQ